MQLFEQLKARRDNALRRQQEIIRAKAAVPSLSEDGDRFNIPAKKLYKLSKDETSKLLDSLPPCRVCNQPFRDLHPTAWCKGLEGDAALKFDAIPPHVVHLYCPNGRYRHSDNQLCTLCEEESSARKHEETRLMFSKVSSRRMAYDESISEWKKRLLEGKLLPALPPDKHPGESWGQN